MSKDIRRMQGLLKKIERLENRNKLLMIRAAFPPEIEKAAAICARPWEVLKSGKDWPFDKDQTAFINNAMEIRANEILELKGRE